MLAVIVALPKEVIREERLPRPGRAEQEHVIVIDEALIPGAPLDIDGYGDVTQPVHNLERPSGHRTVERLIDPHAQHAAELLGHEVLDGYLARAPGAAGPVKRRQVVKRLGRHDPHRRQGGRHLPFQLKRLAPGPPDKDIDMRQAGRERVPVDSVNELLYLTGVHPVLGGAGHRHHPLPLRVQVLKHLRLRRHEDILVDDMLAVEPYAKSRGVRQVKRGRPRGQLLDPDDIGHLAGELLRLGYLEPQHNLVGDTDLSGQRLHVTTQRPLLAEHEITVDEPRPSAASLQILLSQPPGLDTPSSGDHGDELIRLHPELPYIPGIRDRHGITDAERRRGRYLPGRGGLARHSDEKVLTVGQVTPALEVPVEAIGQVPPPVLAPVPLIEEHVLAVYHRPRRQEPRGRGERGHYLVIPLLGHRVRHGECDLPANRDIASLGDDTAIREPHYRDNIPESPI